MTQEEMVRFALMLREADRVRAMIAEDEATEAERGPGEDLLSEAPLSFAA
jgi:hypothetical protein